MATATVKVNGVPTEVKLDAKAGVKYIEEYKLNRNPDGLNDLAKAKIQQMQEKLKKGEELTLNTLGFAKLLFMKVIVPTPLIERIETVRCVHAGVVEAKMVRCDNVIVNTRKVLSECKSLCMDHNPEYWDFAVDRDV